jgi:N-acetylglucosamine kinase-like BadF-type ATPase
MILFTDGGSTKCDWILLNEEGDVVLKTQTKGLNPAVVAATELNDRIRSNADLMAIAPQVETLDFYGAGCSTATPVAALTQVLKSIFKQANVGVYEDTIAAVYAATNTPGIVCILGTGSNSCYFDGTTIHTPIPALGYSVMDEASGNYFGKQLLRDFFYGKMPQSISAQFQKTYNLDPDEIKTNLYKRSNANAYLATFAEFIFRSKEMNTYFYKLLEEGIDRFIARRILTFPDATQLPVHFIGSIAHFSEAIIKKRLAAHNLEMGRIVQRPIDGLIAYYRNQLT